jgi:hypothetical protein
MEYTDILSSFILEYKSNLSEFDTNQFKSNCKVITEAAPVFGDFAIAAISPEMYCRYIQKTVDNLRDISADTDELDDFYSKIYKGAYLTNKNIAIPLQAEDNVEKIRPEYLSNIANDFDVLIKGILNGTIKDTDIRKKYVTGDYFEKLKKQLVKTTIVMNDVRDLMVLDDPTIVKVDNMFIQASVIPFVREYPQKVKDMLALSDMVTGKISSSHSQITTANNAITQMMMNNSVSPEVIRLLRFAQYNLMRQYQNLCAYVSAMLIRKISYYGFNIMQYTNLQNTIYNYFPEGDLVLHESVIDCNLDDIDDSTLLNSIINDDFAIITPHIQNAIGKTKMQLANYMSNKYNVKLTYLQDISSEECPYDVFPYASANKTLMDIYTSLNTFDNTSKNTDLVVDEIVQSSGLEETFTTKFSDVLTGILNTNFYNNRINSDTQTNGATTLALYNDIDHFEKNVKIISRNVSRCYKYLETMIDDYSTNINNLDDNTYSELKSFVEQLMKNFKDYVLHLTKKLLERLDSLTDSLDDADFSSNESEPEQFVPYDYALDAKMEAYTDIEIMENNTFTRLLTEYTAIKHKKRFGTDVVFESDDEAKSTTPTVKTDAQQQNTNNSNTNSSNNNYNGEKTESLTEKFKNWWKNLLAKWRKKSAEATAKNNKWLTNVKANIKKLNFDNTTITVASYEFATQSKLSSDITSSINKINSIQASNLPNELKGKSDDAQAYLFNSIPKQLGKDTSFTGRIKQFLTFGKTDKVELKTYSGNDAKTAVDEMITYCEQYSNIHRSISNDLDKLCNAAMDKQQDILNVTSANTSKTESVHIFEAGNAGEVTQNGTAGKISDNDKGSLRSSNVITSVTRDYASSVMTVLEKKYFDYIKVLMKLAPKSQNNTQPEPQDKSDNSDEDSVQENRKKES